MNKIKTAIADLQAYLNKDRHGVQLLAEVSKQTNAVRKELAAANEKLASQKNFVVSLQEQIATLQAESADMKRQLQIRDAEIQQKTLEAKQQQAALNEATAALDKIFPATEPLERDVKAAARSGLLRAKSETELPVLLQNTKKYAQVFDSLRREVRVCPKFFSNGDTKDIRRVHLEDLVNDYSDAELLKLGKFVVCFALMFDNLVVSPTARWRDTVVMGKTFSDSQLRKLSVWFGSLNVDMRDDDERARGLPERPVGSTANNVSRFDDRNQA